MYINIEKEVEKERKEERRMAVKPHELDLVHIVAENEAPE